MAGEVTLTCTDPANNDDGTPLTDLAGVRIYEANVTGGPYVQVEDVADCGSIPILTRPAGDYYFVSTAYNITGVESIYSNEATHTVPPVAPDPPSNLVADGNLVAYSISITKDIFNTYPVGTVPSGTPCDSNMSANGLYLVPYSAVEFAGGADATVVFAECGTG